MLSWGSCWADWPSSGRGLGAGELHALVRREGVIANHKRVYRVYHEEGLAMRRRKGGRMGASVAAVPKQPNERWSMDFVSDCLANA